MGCFVSRDVRPASDKSDSSGFKGPVKERSCTDVPCLLLFVIFSLFWIALVVYSYHNGNIYRLINGYDDCGNVCGRVTEKVPNSTLCTGADMTDKPYTLTLPKDSWPTKKRICVSSCENNTEFRNYKSFLHRCVPDSNFNDKSFFMYGNDIQILFQEVSSDIYHSIFQILKLSAWAFGLSFFLLFLFRYCAMCLLWAVVIGTVLVSFCTSFWLWLRWKNKNDLNNINENEDENSTTYFILAVFATFVSFILLIIIVGLRKRINLVAQLFHEAGKAIQKMPLIIVQPIFASIMIVLMLFMCGCFFTIIESSGFPEIKKGTNRIHYRKDDFMMLARWFNIFAAFWLLHFFTACQHMVIAGSVATWFFTRNKDRLQSPIGKSISYLLNYHLGSVAFGSLVITVLQVVRMIYHYFKDIFKNKRNDLTNCVSDCCSSCVSCVEMFLSYLSRNAYIEVAIYGDNLWTSGARAFKVIVTNYLRVMTINLVGDFVLFLGKVLVVAITFAIGYHTFKDNTHIQHPYVPIALVLIFSYYVANCFMNAFEMVIDTIFICFCEDCDINDGTTRPYFMSKKLMEFIENSQKVLRVGDGDEPPQEMRSKTANWDQ